MHRQKYTQGYSAFTYIVDTEIFRVITIQIDVQGLCCCPYALIPTRILEDPES